MQNSQWQIKPKTNKQLSRLRLYILLHRGAKFSKTVPQRVADTLVFV